MKHLIESRLGALEVLTGAIGAGLADRLCLVVDLQGRLKVLAKLADAQAADALANDLNPKLAQKCESFWTGDIWFDREKTHPMGRIIASDTALFTKVWAEAKPEPAGQAGVFTLDRRYSKEAWFSTKIEPVWEIGGAMPPIISFFSYKGGVGRTTALAALTIQCARSGKRVLVMDFDLEAPGIGSVFPCAGATPKVGILDYLLEKPVVGNAFDVKEIPYQFSDPKVIQGGEPILIVPSGVVDEWYLEKLGRLNYSGMSEAMLPGSKSESALKSLLHQLRAEYKPDLILIDSRAGLHDLGGLTLSGLAHWHVIFGLDSEQSWLGLRVAIARLGKEQILSGKPQEDCMVVQSMVPPQAGKAESIERFRAKSYDVFREEFYNAEGEINPEWPLPDALDTQQPHFAFPLIYDNKVMGYRTVDVVADYLCEGDFKNFGNALLQKVNIAL